MNTKDTTKRTFRSGTAWKVLVDEWKQSGSSVAEYCKEKKIAESGFYYWRSHFYPSPKKVLSKQKINTFVPVVIASEPTSAKVILIYPNGCQLQINRIDLNTLKLLNQAMGV